MLLIKADRFGGPDVLTPREAPEPVAGPGEAVIDIAVADTLHLDTVIRRGAFPFPVVTPPYVPGGGVAGVVRTIGPDVAATWLGQRVVARTGAPEPAGNDETVAQRAARDSHTGGYAEQVAVPVGSLVPIPREVSARTAAALVNDGMTAMLLAEAARIVPDEWVLVTPAGGGLGNLLVQLAHTAGARVVGAARGERKRRLARDNGAEVTVDYTAEDWTARVRAHTGGRGPRVVMDGIGGPTGEAALAVTARGGRFIGYGAPSGTFANVDGAADRGVTACTLLELPAGDGNQHTDAALAKAATGQLRPIIGQHFPLTRATDAHTAIESRDVLGKTLLLTEK